ncbi:MAG: hypothetical protein R6V20_06180 [Desulfobia sp.]
MRSEAAGSLKSFVSCFVTSWGGAVEDRGPAIDVLLPEELATELGVGEELVLQFGRDGEGDYLINYGSPLLEKMVNTACSRIPVTGWTLNFAYLKKAGFDRLIQEVFSFRNSVGKVEKSAETMCEYIILYCSYLAQSDEQKEGLLPLAFNRETGAGIDHMAGGLEEVAKESPPGSYSLDFSGEETRRLESLAAVRARDLLARELKPFEESMNRRYRRDVANLNRYYTALRQEMEDSLKRPGLSGQLIADRKEKIDIIPLELSTKKEDLFKKYSIKVSLRLCGVLLLRCPVVKIFYRVSAGRKETTAFLYYNPVVKSLEPLVCRECGSSTFSPGFSEDMAVRCPECA